MSGCSFTGPGWYTMLWRSSRDPTGTTRNVWIDELHDPDRPGLLGVWTRPVVAGDEPHHEIGMRAQSRAGLGIRTTDRAVSPQMTRREPEERRALTTSV